VTTCVAYAGVIAGLGRQYALHSSHIHKVEFTEDDEHVLVASADGVVSQWRLLRHKAGVCVRGGERTREGALTCSSVSQWRLFRRKAGVCVGERTREDAQACSFDGVVSQWRFLCHKAGVCAYERERERTRKGALACSTDSVVSRRRLLCHKAGVRV